MTLGLASRVRSAARVLLGRAMANRSVTIRDDDTLIVSYPKSGNTWLRFLVGNLLLEDSAITFQNLERIVPDIYQNTDYQLLSLPSPRVLKSHEYFDPRYRRVIYLVRDPRDVVVSYYHHHVKFRLIDSDFPIESFAERFVAGNLDQFGTWRENVGGWLGARMGSPAFLLIRYEDLQADPIPELARIALLLGVAPQVERLDRAIQLSTADVMRRLEREQADSWRPTSSTRKDKDFVRSAQVGAWRTELPRASAALVESRWAEQMEALGYRG